MSLEVEIFGTTGLPNTETFGKIDPYVNILIQGMKKKTTVKKGELNPEWNETLRFNFEGVAFKEKDELMIQVKDHEIIGHNRLIGRNKMKMKDVLRWRGGEFDSKLELELFDSHDRPIGSILTVRMKYTPPTGFGPTGSGDSGRVITLEGGKDEKEEEKKEGRDKNEPLSTRKQDFQMKLKVVEARQLPGSGVSSSCRITCYNQKKHTKVIESNNAPFWNELFFFNFNASPAELFDEILLFEIYDSRKSRTESFMGSFKLEMGIIYDEPDHCFVNKWLLLCDPDQISDGHKGYLKISVALLGPGDNPPIFNTDYSETDDDIEANLLRPAGLSLRPASFKLKIYCAEDLPRMDSNFVDGVKMVFGSGERKELVDPFFKFSFAGREVDSDVVYTSFSPTWNSELRLGLWFPSMCERIKLQMYDWDRLGNNDCIGTLNLLIPQISQIGNDSTSKDEDKGFLPMIGPCFVNFYGAPREYSDLPTEFDELNLGKGLGVAYRGRALIELETVLGEPPITPMEDLTSDDILKAQKYMRRRKFKLHSTFLDASMVSAVDSPVEFEVSIGNYGNRLDEYLPPSVCSTQPSNPIFDGSYYYYLPWSESKPCVVIDCHWEDVIFRLESLNLLIYITDSLEAQLDNIILAQKGNVEITQLASSLITLFDDIIVKCKLPLPEANEKKQTTNLLDRHLLEYRKAVLGKIVEEAKRLREEATDIEESIKDIQNLIKQIKELQVEPQNSIPDVMIWMLVGDKRVAYYRCASNLVIWSTNPLYRGKFCGKLTNFVLKYPGKKAENEKKFEIPALIRGRLWLGLEKDEKEWHGMAKEGELTVLAETYENQVNVLGKWTNKGPTMSRPKWSDVTGKIELNKDIFRPPVGWIWDGDWYVNPELSMLYEKDANRTSFMEDLYECQGRIPGGSWKPATIPYTDVKGDACSDKKSIELPAGWEWVDDWQVDLGRAVDENGWEYAAEATMGGYGPVEKMFHTYRRRRWLRSRKKTDTKTFQQEQEKLKKLIAEGWEHAPLFSMSFHLKEKKMDMVRRRRWHRRMIPQNKKEGSSAVFQFATGLAEEGTQKTYEESIQQNISSAPRMFMHIKKGSKYQLRSYIYQARDLLAADSNGLSDPFARVVFLNQSQSTERVEKTLCPTWDQSLIFDDLQIWGDPTSVQDNPPQVVVEIFDYDTFGAAQFLGRSFAKPVVKLDPNVTKQPVLLKWYPLTKGDKECGEILAAFELFINEDKELPFPPPKRGKVYMVPNGIRPVMVRTAVEVMCWGLRNMKRCELLEVNSPNVEIEINGRTLESKIIKDMSKNPNFDEPLLFFDVMLPKEELYAPPINIKVKDNRLFGRRPLVGIHAIKSMEHFRCEALELEENESEQRGVQLMGSIFSNALSLANTQDSSDGIQDIVVTIEEDIEDDIDWWSKYFASIGELSKCAKYLEQGYDKIQVYAQELEKVKAHNEFTDFCSTFDLTRGKATEDEDSTVAGEFKGAFYVYPLPPDLQAPMPPKYLKNLPTSQPVDCVVRVYVLKAWDLAPMDPGGKADPYIQVKCGKTKVDNRDNYLPNTLEPEFGKVFEIKTSIPCEKDLRVIIRDYDLIGTDDTIGETIIDLENRLLTRSRATCGLPQSYCTTGICKWRDSKKPSEILEEFCVSKLNNLIPVFSNEGKTVTIGRNSYSLSDFEDKKVTHKHLGVTKERLALHLLNNMPQGAVGYPLVAEHVETRSLYNTLQPGIEQGKIQMWVDIFPEMLGPPGSMVDVTPRQPKDYELRVIIWNTKDVILEETSITGEKMSDIYVKGWLGNPNEKQETDVHYRSMDGEGNFNWRFVFPFKYIPTEECQVITEKEHFWSLDATEKRLPPVLSIQIWDNDKFSSDDFLGTLEINLNAMPSPVKTAEKCTLKMLPRFNETGKKLKVVNIFEQKRVKGFWPCFSEEPEHQVDGETVRLTGKVEMEVELVMEDEIEEKPVGKSRDDPNQHPFLEPPKRPETSFFWFTSPWKTFKHIIWGKLKKYFLSGLIILLIGLFIFLFFYTLPGAVANRIVGG